jgi:ABC-type sugar transport system permease subunit
MTASGAANGVDGRRQLPRSRLRHLLRTITGDQAAAVVLIVPSVLAVGVFVYGFIGWSALVSVSKWNTVRPDYTYVGLDNFRTLFDNFRFQIDIRNTIFFTAVFVWACLVIGFGLLRTGPSDQGRVSSGHYLFPMAVSFIVTGVVWSGCSLRAPGSTCSPRRRALVNPLRLVHGPDNSLCPCRFPLR